MKNLVAIVTTVGLCVINFLVCDSSSIILNEKEIECFSQNKIYDVESDKCYKLLTRGPCNSGYWLVLEKPKSSAGKFNPKISAICIEEKCPDGGYYWTTSKTCVQPKDKNILCGNFSNEEIRNNVFGEAECMCKREPVMVRTNVNNNNRCYQLYTQGPCQKGQVLGVRSSSPDNPICITDICSEETLRRRREGTLSRDGVLAPWTNGSCYELGTQGPCPETLKFKIHETTLEPNCITLTNAIFDLEKPQKCFQDENGDCQKKIDSGKFENAEKYKKELLSSLIAIRKRRNIH